MLCKDLVWLFFIEFIGYQLSDLGTKQEEVVKAATIVVGWPLNISRRRNRTTKLIIQQDTSNLEVSAEGKALDPLIK